MLAGQRGSEDVTSASAHRAGAENINIDTIFSRDSDLRNTGVWFRVMKVNSGRLQICVCKFISKDFPGGTFSSIIKIHFF